MQKPEALCSCYADYIAYAHALPKKYTLGAGLFGFSTGPKEDPGHKAFFEAVRAQVDALVQDNPAPEVAFAACDLILFAAAEHTHDQGAYWMLLAAQQHALALFPYLSAAHAEELLRRYDRVYPRRTRLAIQAQLAKALKHRAAGK